MQKMAGLSEDHEEFRTVCNIVSRFILSLDLRNWHECIYREIISIISSRYIIRYQVVVILSTVRCYPLFTEVQDVVMRQRRCPHHEVLGQVGHRPESWAMTTTRSAERMDEIIKVHPAARFSVPRLHFPAMILTTQFCALVVEQGMILLDNLATLDLPSSLSPFSSKEIFEQKSLILPKSKIGRHLKFVTGNGIWLTVGM